MNNAEIHAKIAAKVWPDEEVWVDSKMCIWREPCCIRKGKGERGSGKYFDLLETDGNGEPTTQADSSALKTFKWLVKYMRDTGKSYHSIGYDQRTRELLLSDKFHEDVFNAAKEALDEH